MTDHFRLKKLDYFLADHFGADHLSDFFFFRFPVFRCRSFQRSFCWIVFFDWAAIILVIFFLTRTPDHFQTIILASAVFPVPTACFATSCFHSPLLHNSHTTAVSSNTVNSPVGVASMPQPTNTAFVRSQVALSNPPIVFRFEREWTDAKIQSVWVTRL